MHDLKQEDWVLIRFLRARNYDIAKADDMLRYVRYKYVTIAYLYVALDTNEFFKKYEYFF